LRPEQKNFTVEVSSCLIKEIWGFEKVGGVFTTEAKWQIAA